MKQIKLFTVALLLCAVLVSLFSCAGTETDTATLWKDAKYTEDTTLGDGEKKVAVKVSAGERSVTFTLHTDSETLGEAMVEQSLLEGEQGQFGMYIKKVNGITADYDIDRSYWSISKDGVDLLHGIDSEKISGGESYELARKK